MNSLNGKVAIVTGASKGIGAAIAKGLAAAGAAVAVNYASDKAGAEGTVAEIEAKRGKAIAIKADMSQSTQVRQLFEETRKTLGIPSVLVNNAGVFEFGPIEEVTEANFHRHFNINVLGTMLAVQEAVKHFPAEGGSIVNISSIASESPVPNSSLYAASKGAIDTLVRHFAAALGARGIRVNAVAPGVVATDMSSFAKTDAGRDYALGLQTLKRLAQPDDIADAIAFLASNDARWLTGDTIHVDGGSKL